MFKSGIGFHYNVSNLERTLAFYTDILGFKVLNCDVSQRQARVFTNTKDCIIGFAETDSVVPSSTCITFEAENIDDTMQTLQHKGVKFIGEIMVVPGIVKLATFSDPDGYKLMLYSQA